MGYVYETVTYNKHIPGKILMQDKPGRRCNTTLHWHKEIEIVYMIHGCLHIKINGQDSTIHDGEFYICNSEKVHITYVDDLDYNYTYVVLLLSYEELKKYCPEIDSYSFCSIPSEESYYKIKTQIINIVDSIQKSDSYAFLMQKGYLFNIFHTLLTECKMPKKTAINVKKSGNTMCAKQIIEYINENYREKVTLEEVAREVGFSPQYLSKYFKNLTNCSFIQYLLKVRLEHAVTDMMNREMSVTDAAFENGFTSVKSFIITCKREYGVTPSYYKSKCEH